MSRSTHSTPARHPAGWPIYAYSQSQNNIRMPSMSKAQSLSRSSTMFSSSSRSHSHQSSSSLALVPEPARPAQVARPQYAFWTPPQPVDCDGSDDDDDNDSCNWGLIHDRYSTSTASTASTSTSTSSSEDEESSALALVPKKVPVKFDSDPKKPVTDLVATKHTISNLSGIFKPMNAEQGGMLSVRSPSVHYDKVIHGAMSPATTVHLILPRAAAARMEKPPLPLPTSAKTKPRLPVVQQQQQQKQQHRPTPNETVSSPEVIGLDLALMPPSDHRDSAMSPRSSMAVRTPARPTNLMPVEIPKRRSTSVSGPTIWKPQSAPTPSPLPTRQSKAPMPLTTSHTPRVDTLQPNLNASSSSSSVSINRPIMHATPTPTPAPAPASFHPSIVNERAEILRRTLSSNNMARASKADTALSGRHAEDSPHSSVSSHTMIEKALPTAPSPERSPLVAVQPPAPVQASAQSTIQFPTDDPEAEFELEYVETPPLLRVVNVTEEDFVVFPTSPPPPEPALMPLAPTIEVVPSTPQQPHMELAALADSIVRELTPAPVSVVTAAPEPSPKQSTTPLKHTSLPVPSRPSSHFHRISLSDGPVPPPSTRGSYVQSERPTSSRTPVQPMSRPWLPRKAVMPTLLQPPASLPSLPLPSQPLPARQSFLPPPQGQQFPARAQHGHTSPEPPVVTSQRNSYRPLAPPTPRFAQPENYSSDEDDPSKWASVPEIPSSRRSSRSSRLINRNSIYQAQAQVHVHADTDDEDGTVYPAPPSTSLPNLRSILQSNDIEAPVTRDGSGMKKIQFDVPKDAGDEKPSQAAGGRRRIRRRSNSTDSVIRNSREVPWGTNPSPRKSGLVTIPDPYGLEYVDEGRYDAINHPELIPTDISQRYIRSDGAPKFPEYRETYSAKEKALRAAAELEQRQRILGRTNRPPATSVEFDDAAPPITVPVCLRRPRAVSESGSKLRRRSRSRDRADWGPTPTIPDPEVNQYRPITMSPPSHPLIPSALEKVGRKFSLFRR